MAADDKKSLTIPRQPRGEGEPSCKGIFQAIANEAKDHAPDAAVVEAEENAGVKAEVRAQRLTESGVREAITPEDYDRIVRGAGLFPTHAFKTVEAWHQTFHKKRAGRHVPIVVMYSLTGRGKTVSGAWLIAEEGGCYVTAPEARSVLTSGHWNDARRKDKILRSRVTVFDDLGTEKNDEDAQTALFLFANQRQGLDSGLSLITANLALRVMVDGRVVPEKGLLTRYDERTVNRLQHVGRFVEATGADLRRKVLP